MHRDASFFEKRAEDFRLFLLKIAALP